MMEALIYTWSYIAFGACIGGCFGGRIGGLIIYFAKAKRGFIILALLVGAFIGGLIANYALWNW